MNKILIRYGELYLKGHNRGSFERQLCNNIRETLKGLDCQLKQVSGRFILQSYDEAEESKIVSRLRKVCGIYSVSVAQAISTDFEEIKKAALQISRDAGSFKVITHRADKKYPYNSQEISREVGAFVLENKPQLSVDLFEPDFEINIEVRENGCAYLFSEVLRGCGGLPVGSSGKGLLLLSGGIDSPVAGYMMAKRGMNITGLHFHSFPYTGEMAKEKVIRLAKILKSYTLHMRLNIIPFTKVQDAIHENCPEEFMVILMRRFMMRIANRVCKEQKLDAIVTGENLAQVASQTIQSITVTNELAARPVLRPVIGFDKVEIIEIARKIDTYETSIQPYEDCCTVFLPKHPVIKPKLDRVIEAEKALAIDELVEYAVQNKEIIEI